MQTTANYRHTSSVLVRVSATIDQYQLKRAFSRSSPARFHYRGEARSQSLACIFKLDLPGRCFDWQTVGFNLCIGKIESNRISVAAVWIHFVGHHVRD